MRLHIPPSTTRVPEVRQAARSAFRFLPRDIAYDLLVALDEAVANAVTHGSSGGGPVEVSITVIGGWVELRVLDRGPTPTVPRLPDEPPPPTALGGRGLWLIRQLADEVRVEPAGSGVLLAIRRRVGPHGSPAERPWGLDPGEGQAAGPDGGLLHGLWHALPPGMPAGIPAGMPPRRDLAPGGWGEGGHPGQTPWPGAPPRAARAR